MSSRAESEECPGEPGPKFAAAEVVGERLWAPWRMRYVAGGEREEGCIFCNRLTGTDDVQSLILHRGETAFVIMNRYPYNTGHVMIVPNMHVSSPEDADPGVMSEMATLRGPVLRAIRRTLSAEGFNLGLNVGAVAGAGVADHLHEHVVPRWLGDANFMPILASTMVIPELIPVTYAKLRAELNRELRIATSVTAILLSEDRDKVLVEESGELPLVDAREGEPIWRTALHDAFRRGAIGPEIVGWFGTGQSNGERPAFVMRARFPAADHIAPGNRLVTPEELFAGPEAELAQMVLQRSGGTHGP